MKLNKVEHLINPLYDPALHKKSINELSPDDVFNRVPNTMITGRTWGIGMTSVGLLITPDNTNTARQFQDEFNSIFDDVRDIMGIISPRRPRKK